MASTLLSPSSDAQADAIIADSITQKLTSQLFDPVDFLNETLSALPSQSQQMLSKAGRAQQSQEISSQIQVLLSKLSSQNIRYANVLTQLTDEILRSGSRLTYEVEILRGDANGLYDALTNTLQEDVNHFCLANSTQHAVKPTSNGQEETFTINGLPDIEKLQDGIDESGPEPIFISQLRMLGQARNRLEEVTALFGKAMEWPLTPSEPSIASSLISVSAPEPGPDGHTQEGKAREMAGKLRQEVLALLERDGGRYSALEAASQRVESLRQLAGLWKGTVEEKPRNKFVDGLAKLIDDRRKVLDDQAAAQQQRTDSMGQRSSSMPERPALGQTCAERNVTEGSVNPGGGLFRNLQRLRDEIYLD